MTDVAAMPPAASTDGPVFEVDHVTLRFGGVTSLADVSLTQQRGEILAVIGPNGAGKTSLFNCLTGVYTPQEGSIHFHPSASTAPNSMTGDGPTSRTGMARTLLNARVFGAVSRRVRPSHGAVRSIVGVKPYKVSRMGVARTFQNSRMFGAMTTFENVKIGAEARQHSGPIGIMLRLPRMHHEELESDNRALELLRFVGLEHRAGDMSSSLPYGDRRRLEIARALGTSPEVLLLDEPAAGTNPSEKQELAELIRRVNLELGVSILLIEHDMKIVMSVAQRIIVLNFGLVIAEGTPAEIQRNPLVVDAYLGTTHGTDDEADG